MATIYEGGLLPAPKQVEPGRDWLKNLQDDLSGLYKNLSVKRGVSYDATCLNGWSKTGDSVINYMSQMTTVDGLHINYMVFNLQGGTVSPGRTQDIIKVPDEFKTVFVRPVSSNIYVGKTVFGFDEILDVFFKDPTTISVNMSNANGTTSEEISNAHISGALLWVG